MKQNLYIWNYTSARQPKGIPSYSNNWLSEIFSPEDPKPIEGQWVSFNPYRDKPPLKEELKLPSQLYLFLRTKETPIFDWFYIHHHVMAVSEKFLAFLLENDLKEQIEIAELKIFNRQGIEFNEKKYFAIRIIKFNDSIFNLNEEIRKRAKGIKDEFLYPQMKLNTENEKQNIFFLLEFCYNESLLITEKAKDYILSNFYKPEIYRIEDYPLVFNNSNSLENLPNNIVS